MDDAQYHRNSVILLGLTCVALGVLGYVAVRIGAPALASVAQIAGEAFWDWRLLAPFALYTVVAGAFGWFSGWMAERRGLFSPVTYIAMPIAILLVAAGLCAATGETFPFPWGLTLLSLMAMLISGWLRWKMGEMI